MKYKASLGISLVLSLLAFAGLLAFPGQASEGARNGLALCARVIVPSLFPLAAVSKILLELRLPEKLGGVFEPVTRTLFGVSGRGSAAFFLGLTGGYPLGAVTISEMYSSKQLDRREAVTLLGFCDNSGPAFIVAATGTAIFNSPSIGFFLYGIHILAAVLTGVLLRGRTTKGSAVYVPAHPAPFAEALTRSVKGAAASSVTICGFVVFFSVLTSLLDASGFLPSLCGVLSARLGMELRFARGLVTGLLELGTGIGAMEGLPPTAQNLALASFILGWGGLSVQAQAASALADSRLPAGRHVLGKMIHGTVSAALTLALRGLVRI